MASPFESSRRIETNPKKDMAQLIPFAELTGGTETVRFTVIQEKTYMSIRDVIMVVCKKDKDMAGRVWRDLKNPYKEEVRHFCRTSNFQGRVRQMVL